MKKPRLSKIQAHGTALLVLAGILILAAVDCVYWPEFGPPGMRAEVVVGRPGPGYFWIEGYWGWRGGNYYWVRGRWERERPGRSWVQGRWEQRGRRWVRTEGHWR